MNKKGNTFVFIVTGLVVALFIILATLGFVAGKSGRLMQLKAFECLGSFWAYLVGYCISVIGGHVATMYLVDGMWNRTKTKDKPKERWQVRILGCLERALYTASVYHYKTFTFIGSWLIVKIVGSWRYEKDKEEKLTRGRPMNNIFLIGNLLSIIFGVAGAKFIGWLLNKPMVAFAAGLVLVAGFLVLWSWLEMIPTVTPVDKERQDAGE